MKLIPYPLFILLAVSPLAAEHRPTDRHPDRDIRYEAAITRAADMVRDHEAVRLVTDEGLSLLSLTWEDTGRYKGSAIGPNISDMTIQVEHLSRDDRPVLTCMPVIRHANFADKSADISPDRFYLLVGNEDRAGHLHRVTLRDFLADMRRYLSDASSWPGSERSLLADRDEAVLVSAQAAFLPVSRGGKATFNPVIFNYQSTADDPAVLTILATREGTSVTVIDNKRDAFRAGNTWGQRLFFNQAGERASLTGERKSDRPSDRMESGQGPSVEAAGEEGPNMVLLIQVPLKQRERKRFQAFGETEGSYGIAASAPLLERRSDVEAAVIGHGEAEGPFTEIDGHRIERDARFPIRVTVQFYKATSNGQISESDVREISRQIDRVYQDADYVGSLVVDGDTRRPTEHDAPKFEPPGWWSEFWRKHYQESGMNEEQTLEFLRRLFGPNWTNIPTRELRRGIERNRRELRD